MHCQNPPCANLCPWGAAAREDNGIVRIDAEICLGGAKCKTVCPWGIPMRQTGVGLYLKLLPRYGGNGVMYKCDRCVDRVAAGQKPACIEACPYDVQEIGPRAEMVAKAHALARDFGLRAVPWDERAKGIWSLIINATPLGTTGEQVSESPWPSDGFANVSLVFDMVYNPVRTKLIQEAQAAGVECISGQNMFLHQGLAQFELWTGKRLDEKRARQLLMADLVMTGA